MVLNVFAGGLLGRVRLQLPLLFLRILFVSHQKTRKGHQLRRNKSCKKRRCRQRPYQRKHEREHQHGERQLSYLANPGRSKQSLEPRDHCAAPAAAAPKRRSE